MERLIAEYLPAGYVSSLSPMVRVLTNGNKSEITLMVRDKDGSKAKLELPIEEFVKLFSICQERGLW